MNVLFRGSISGFGSAEPTRSRQPESDVGGLWAAPWPAQGPPTSPGPTGKTGCRTRGVPSELSPVWAAFTAGRGAGSSKNLSRGRLGDVTTRHRTHQTAAVRAGGSCPRDLGGTKSRAEAPGAGPRRRPCWQAPWARPAMPRAGPPAGESWPYLLEASFRPLEEWLFEYRPAQPPLSPAAFPVAPGGTGHVIQGGWLRSPCGHRAVPVGVPVCARRRVL